MNAKDIYILISAKNIIKLLKVTCEPVKKSAVYDNSVRWILNKEKWMAIS